MVVLLLIDHVHGFGEVHRGLIGIRGSTLVIELP